MKRSKAFAFCLLVAAIAFSCNSDIYAAGTDGSVTDMADANVTESENTTVTNVCQYKDDGTLMNIKVSLESMEGILGEVKDDVRNIKDDIEDIKEDLERYRPRVTVVRSVNNKIPNAYYKPRLRDIPLLEELILENGDFVVAYTGFFDIDKSEPYKPTNQQSRALEVLGYDFLLKDENYNGTDYNAVDCDEQIEYGTAIMDIYKALGKYETSVSLYMKADSSLKLDNSPAVKELPSFINNVDNSSGATDVFITRTNRNLYYKRAAKDLNMSSSGFSKYITNSEFIILLARMMYMYGEPVMSEAEENILLQFYGAEVPTYLTASERKAYLYLKARGVLNVDLDFRADLQLKDMLDILMCVKDADSRTDYKKVQLTMNLDDELINKGYFPRELTISSGDSAIEVSDTTLDYSDTNYYDYYLEISDSLVFNDLHGEMTEELFVPSVPCDTSSVGLDGASYLGIEGSANGSSYYHFRVKKMSQNDAYIKACKEFSGSTEYFQVNSSNDTDKPVYVWVQQGGGIYTATNKVDDNGGIYLERRALLSDEFKGGVTREREETKVSEENVFMRVAKYILPESKIVRAAGISTSNPFESYYSDTSKSPKAIFYVYNANIITGWNKAIPDLKVTEDKEKNVLKVTVPSEYKEYFFASITTDSKKVTTSNKYTGISTIDGKVLISYSDLVKAGVFYNSSNGTTPRPEASSDGKILILHSAYGQVKLNKDTNEIVVGNTLYVVQSKDTVLFQYLMQDGEQILMIDFRAAYGWTSNIADITITGTGENYTVNLQTLEASKKRDTLTLATVTPPDPFKTSRSLEVMQFIDKGLLAGAKTDKALMVSDYCLANWMIYQGYSKSAGTTVDYAFVFYPKEAFTGKAPSGLEDMKEIVGYTISAPNWVCRVVELQRRVTEEPGQFTYNEDFGYMYNLPEWSDFKMGDYLKGKLLLPISITPNKNIINANVNVFPGYKYGTRPTSTVDTGINIKDKSVAGKATKTQSTVMIATPVGVSSLYGGDMRAVYKAGSPQVQESSTSSNAIKFFYGSTLCEVSKNSGGLALKISFTSSSVSKWSTTWKIDKSAEFTLVNKRAYNSNSGSTQYSFRWVMFEDVLMSEVIALTDNGKTNEEVSVIDGERKDLFNKFEDFSFEDWVNQFDSWISYLIIFTVVILPYVGIAAVTILLGLSLISQFKIVQLICKKTIDPVRWLTFGTLTIEELEFKNAFIGLMLAYLIFAIILRGNFIHLIQWVLRWYNVFWDLLRQRL